MTTSHRPVGRPRIPVTTDETAEADLSALVGAGAAYREARAAQEASRVLLRAKIEDALIAGVHYFEVARLAGVSKKMTWNVKQELLSEGRIRYLGASEV